VTSILFGLTVTCLSFSSAQAQVLPRATKVKAKAQPVSLARALTAMSTSLKSGHPILFLNGEAGRAGRAPDLLATRLQFPVDQKYSKWSVVFNKPLEIDSVEVETCKGTKPFADGVELFLDFNVRRYFSDGGGRLVKFKVKRAATALTLNFLESQGLCLETIRLATKNEWLRPRALPAIGDLVVADGSYGTFDRRVPDGKKTKWEGARKAGVWKLEWESPLIVDGLRIWNGNQYPGAAFGDSDKVRELDVIVDGGDPMRFALEDVRGFQNLKIEPPRAIRKIELRSVSVFSNPATGNQETLKSEPVLSEVQILAGGEVWFPVVPVVASEADVESESVSAKQARAHGYGDIVDRELRTEDQKNIWKFRFRSDGTFYARIFVDKVRVARSWSSTGTWRILEVVRKSEKGEVTGLVLLLTGSKTATAHAEDSLSCAEECGTAQSAAFLVEETVEIQRQGTAAFFLRNRTSEEDRSIEFSDLKLRRHSLYD